ncbi:MAG TPA: DUF58 domain-containing protein [Cytophagaceae bacterium]|jgi:hypothetical protein|nr:DUF58 domain-containing protein [Cytophagaceae bacterium]
MKKIAYYFSFIPFQLNFFVLLFILSGALAVVQHKYFTEVEESNYFILLLKILALFTLVFSAIIVGLAFITALICWLYFLFYKNALKESPIQASIGEGEKAQSGYVSMGLKASGIIKPLLGHVKGRIVFSDGQISPALTLDQPVFGNNRFLRNAIKASRPVWIPDIKEHTVTKVVVYFEDMFRLFSFPFILSNPQKLLTIPSESDKMNVEVNPDKTVEQEQRIETPKRIHGELFNYKNFESGDDIRRIVWKIYAKNKELVVKVPETTDPYASHIYFHPSFYSVDFVSSDIKKAMLNYYKIKIRQLYEALSRSEFTVKYLPDQELMIPDTTSDEDPAWLYFLSTSVWQTNKSVTDYISAKKDGIYCISSLIPISEVEEMLNNKTPDTLVFFVKVSSMWRKRQAFNFFSLFVKMEEHPLDALKRKWLFSSGRSKILRNEKQIQQYLEDQLFKNIIL